jgi:hypothetical protein
MWFFVRENKELKRISVKKLRRIVHYYSKYFILPLAPFSRRGLVFIYVWFSKLFFYAPLKIMTNQKSPANFWRVFSGHGLLVMKSSTKDAGPIYCRGSV